MLILLKISETSSGCYCKLVMTFLRVRGVKRWFCFNPAQYKVEHIYGYKYQVPTFVKIPPNECEDVLSASFCHF